MDYDEHMEKYPNGRFEIRRSDGGLAGRYDYKSDAIIDASRMSGKGSRKGNTWTNVERGATYTIVEVSPVEA